ncbi:MAG: hypothetical protein IJ725_03620 [Ruminococcus sp.]|nr:hypothetical protein [Ruminococcus sp.]
MKNQKLRARVHIEINGKPELWYEVDEEGSVVWHLPKDIGKGLKTKMLNNISSSMSRYVSANKNSSLWGATV